MAKILVTFCLFWSFALGQIPRSSRTITIGDTELSVGMSKARVLTALAKQHAVENSGQFVDGAEVWFVKAKDASDAAAGAGTLQFKNDVLVSADKEWDYFEADRAVTRLMHDLYGAMEGATKETKSGSVKYEVRRSPDKSLQAIIFYFGTRTVTLGLGEGTLAGKPYSTISLTEGLNQ